MRIKAKQITLDTKLLPIKPKKKQKEIPVVKKPKEKVKRYAFLHIPSGQYLKLSNNSGYSTEAKNNIFKYSKIHLLVSSFLRNYSSTLDIKRIEPIPEMTNRNIIFNIPGTNIKLMELSLSKFDRIDTIALYENPSWPFIINDKDITLLTDFKADPTIYFNFWIEFEGMLIELLLDTDEYAIKINNTESWDTVMMELFTYLQENQYSMKLIQFSKDKLTSERILLTEFEIVEIYV